MLKTALSGGRGALAGGAYGTALGGAAGALGGGAAGSLRELWRQRDQKKKDWKKVLKGGGKGALGGGALGAGAGALGGTAIGGITGHRMGKSKGKLRSAQKDEWNRRHGYERGRQAMERKRRKNPTLNMEKAFGGSLPKPQIGSSATTKDGFTYNPGGLASGFAGSTDVRGQNWEGASSADTAVKVPARVQRRRQQQRRAQQSNRPKGRKMRIGRSRRRRKKEAPTGGGMSKSKAKQSAPQASDSRPRNYYQNNEPRTLSRGSKPSGWDPNEYY